jgi:hypothetical protein
MAATQHSLFPTFCSATPPVGSAQFQDIKKRAVVAEGQLPHLFHPSQSWTLSVSVSVCGPPPPHSTKPDLNPKPSHKDLRVQCCQPCPSSLAGTLELGGGGVQRQDCQYNYVPFPSHTSTMHLLLLCSCPSSQILQGQISLTPARSLYRHFVVRLPTTWWVTQQRRSVLMQTAPPANVSVAAVRCFKQWRSSAACHQLATGGGGLAPCRNSLPPSRGGTRP